MLAWILRYIFFITLTEQLQLLLMPDTLKKYADLINV
jgi:hypothetical protein